MTEHTSSLGRVTTQLLGQRQPVVLGLVEALLGLGHRVGDLDEDVVVAGTSGELPRQPVSLHLGVGHLPLGPAQEPP